MGPGFDHFDAHALRVFAIGTLRQVTHRHTTVPTFLDEPVSTDLPSHHVVARKGKNLTTGTPFQETLVVMREQRFNFRVKRLVITAGLPKKRLALTRTAFQGGVEQLINLLPLFSHCFVGVPVHSPALKKNWCLLPPRPAGWLSGGR